MISFLFGTDFWLSSTPLLLAGLLAALAVLVWDWRISLPATLFVQLLLGQVAAQRSLIPDEWGRVFAWVVVGCLLILFLSIQRSAKVATVGRLGTFIFRGLLLGLAGFLLSSVDVTDLLPLLDLQMIRAILWLALCALFGISAPLADWRRNRPVGSDTCRGGRGHARRNLPVDSPGLCLSSAGRKSRPGGKHPTHHRRCLSSRQPITTYTTRKNYRMAATIGGIGTARPAR
jgi:signal transduction histidine kinase